LPIDQHRRDEIAAAVAAYNQANLREPLPRYATRLLVTMFPNSSVCRRSLEELVAEGFPKRALLGTLRRLEAAGFLSRQLGTAAIPDTCRLHLPTRAQPTPRRREIEAAVAAHNATDREPGLPPAAVRLLATMFRHADVCQRSLDSLAAEGIDRRAVSRLLRALVEIGFLTKEPQSGRAPNTYTLHLPPPVQP
jgi:hypothetical protein